MKIESFDVLLDFSESQFIKNEKQEKTPETIQDQPQKTSQDSVSVSSNPLEKQEVIQEKVLSSEPERKVEITNDSSNKDSKFGYILKKCQVSKKGEGEAGLFVEIHLESKSEKDGEKSKEFIVRRSAADLKILVSRIGAKHPFVLLPAWPTLDSKALLSAMGLKSSLSSTRTNEEFSIEIEQFVRKILSSSILCGSNIFEYLSEARLESSLKWGVNSAGQLIEKLLTNMFDPDLSTSKSPVFADVFHLTSLAKNLRFSIVSYICQRECYTKMANIGEEIGLIKSQLPPYNFTELRQILFKTENVIAGLERANEAVMHIWWQISQKMKRLDYTQAQASADFFAEPPKVAVEFIEERKEFDLLSEQVQILLRGAYNDLQILFEKFSEICKLF